MKITFLLPGRSEVPVGGYKIVFEYANRLANDGYNVSILYPIYLMGSRNIRRKIKDVLRYFRYKGRFSSNIWFPINPSVNEEVVYSYYKLPDSDVYVCTSVETAILLNKAKKQKKSSLVYFIQGYENWGISEEELHNTYRYPFKKIVISPYLHKKVEEQGQDCYYIPNGFNPEEFSLSIPIEEKDAATISILYHTQEVKEFSTGFNAICLAKEKHPEIKAILFGAYERPEGLPDWCEFYFNPNIKTHNEINNRAAIYVGPSRSEGFGLTIGEAMMCGQAVACTDNSGYTIMAHNNQNALVSKVSDSGALAQNIIRLIEDNDLRIRIATNGYEDIKKFSLDKAYGLFRKVIESETENKK